MFVNRREELSALGKLVGSTKFELSVLYGRRRIGKTRLVLEAVQSHEHYYYLAVEKDNLRYFIEMVAKRRPEVKKLKEDWEVILEFLAGTIIVIDEFQNLVKENHTILSVFQRAVDTSLAKSPTKLILLGSSTSLMSSAVLNYKSPLYGRKTYSSKVQAINFFNIGAFFPEVSVTELAEIYGFADGIPFYLEKVKTPFWAWLENELVAPSFLKDELDFILKYEFEELGTYKLILEAIANGKTTIAEIKNYCKLPRTDISPYLSKLVNTELVYRVVPITERPISKKGRYYIKDQFVSFWFRYIHPNLSNFEERIFHADDIKQSYPQYMGFVFEKIARQFVAQLARKKVLNYSKIGKWWEKDQEIDLVALNDDSKEALFGECKWQDNVDARQIVEELKHKASFVQWNNKTRKERYAVFAKSFKEKPKIEDTILFDLNDFKKELA